MKEKTDSPQPTFETPQEIPKQPSRLPFIITGAILLVIAVGVGGWYLGKNSISAPVSNILSPTPIIVRETERSEARETYSEDEGFSFTFPTSMNMFYPKVKANEKDVIWKSEYTPGDFYNSMLLRKSTYPFDMLRKGVAFGVYESSADEPDPIQVIIDEVVESKEITIDGKSAQEITLSCGMDCYYHVLRFNVGNSYYELVSNGAGGGLRQRFDDIIESFTFSDSSASSTDSGEWQKQSLSRVSWSENWKSFNLYYPQTWKYENLNPDSRDVLDINLRKDTVNLRILQAASDAGACNYPDEPQKEGMLTAYKEYIEIPKGNGITWRLSHNPKYSDKDTDSYHVCEKDDANTEAFLPYGGFTSIGLIDLSNTEKTTDPSILKEVEDILTKIELQ